MCQVRKKGTGWKISGDENESHTPCRLPWSTGPRVAPVEEGSFGRHIQVTGDTTPVSTPLLGHRILDSSIFCHYNGYRVLHVRGHQSYHSDRGESRRRRSRYLSRKRTRGEPTDLIRSVTPRTRRLWNPEDPSCPTHLVSVIFVSPVPSFHCTDPPRMGRKAERCHTVRPTTDTGARRRGTPVDTQRHRPLTRLS